MTISRRTVLQTGYGLALVAALTPGLSIALAQSADGKGLHASGPLGDKTLGDKNAPVTIVEYTSMTCSYCSDFHVQTYPALRAEFIETGKVRFILREFPLDAVSAAAFMLARSAPKETYFDVIDLMFEQQSSWAFTENPYNSLLSFSKQIGFTQGSFEKALKNQELLDAINAVRDRGANEFGVNSTPTFFVNGKMHRGFLSKDQFDTLIKDES